MASSKTSVICIKQSPHCKDYINFDTSSLRKIMDPSKIQPQQVKLQNPANHPTLDKGKRHGWGPLLKRNSKVLLPPPQLRPGEKDCIIHQLRDNKRLIFKYHIISSIPDRYCCCYPPNLPLSIRSPRSSQGEVLSEVVPRPTMQDSVRSTNEI